ncbi:MAG: AAA family ATPase [Verrucomicrobiota bacterium]
MAVKQPASTLADPEEICPAAELAGRVLEQLDRILLGRNDIHRLVFVGILSRGHILLEGLPGLGKTALVRALGEILRLDFKRIQFTPDLMPGDILGNHILQQREDGHRDMVFEPGPVFTNLLLADEINRASPKTQSAMLETMQERSVTLLGNTRKLPDPFFLLASQNPIELEGTYPLPEAQLDRFMFKIVMGSLGADVLNNIVSTRRHGAWPEPTWTMSAEELNTVFGAVDRIFLPRPVARYISRLVASTHAGEDAGTELVRDYVSYGASPRAAIAIAEASRAHALLANRPTVGFEDAKAVAPAVLNHRIILNYKARFEGVDTLAVVANLLESLDETELDLPVNVSLEESSA